MVNSSAKSAQASSFTQFIVSFLVPIVILTRFSSESQLGPTKGLLLALAFPICFEIYNVKRRRKLSLLSLLAIGGIIVTGAISLLGLSEGWLALRRSVPYFAVSVVLFVSMLAKHPLLNMILPKVIDMEAVNERARDNNVLTKLNKSLSNTNMILSAVLILIATASYILTRVIIASKTGTTEFNQEYAKLRLLSLPIISLPLLVGVTGSLLYLMHKIEKLTGLDTDSIIHKNHNR